MKRKFVVAGIILAVALGSLVWLIMPGSREDQAMDKDEVLSPPTQPVFPGRGDAGGRDRPPVVSEAGPPTLETAGGHDQEEQKRPSVVEALLGTEGERRIRPPFTDAEGHPPVPSPYDSTVLELAREIAMEAGPDTAKHARNLVLSEQDGVGLVGAKLLAELPGWDWEDDLIDALVGHRDPAVPLVALQALRDAGQWEQAEALLVELATRLHAHHGGIEALLTGDHGMPGLAARAWIDVSRDLLDEAARREAVMAIATADTMDYGARMRALLELQAMLPFEDFRAVVRDEHQRASVETPTVWQIGVERLSQRLEGPVEVHAGTPLMTVTDVHVMTAREHPAMYEDLALRLESMSQAEDHLFGEGITETLRVQIKEARQFPLSDSEAAALRRIEHLLPRIEESDVTGLVPPPPPGT